MERNNVVENNIYSFIDLFAGCGGLSLGLINAGLRGVFAVEKDPMAFETLRTNLIEANGDEENIRIPKYDWPKEHLSIRNYTIHGLLRRHSKFIKSMRGKIDLIAAGPPCQGFSTAGTRDRNDKRNNLFKSYLKFVEYINPTMILIENVRGMAVGIGKSKSTGKKGRPPKAYSKRITEILQDKLGYKVFCNLVDAVAFGVPQKRRRYFIIGIRRNYWKSAGEPDPFKVLFDIREAFLESKGLPKDRAVKAKEAIMDLESKEFEECKDKDSPRGFLQGKYTKSTKLSSFQKLLRTRSKEKLPQSHRFVKHLPSTKKAFMKIINECKRKPGWPNELVKLTKEDRKRIGIRSKKHTINVMVPEAASPTLTTLPDDILHYSEPRILTVKECARLQSFPDWYKFKGKYTTGGRERKNECPRYTQVGNAVSPLLAEALGKAIKIILDKLKE